MNQSKFPIGTISELAALIGIPEVELRRIAASAEKSYSRWQEPKPSGGFRNLSSPMPHLKDVQKKLHSLLFSKITFGQCSHYGIKRKSNITNAHEHCRSGVVFTFDLKSFFPSIRPERVKKALTDELGCPKRLAEIITRLVTVDFQLPQGAPTSTDIANIVTLRLQRRLYHLATQWGITKFTIYADDITFSGSNIPEGFTKMVARVIRHEGFKIHPEKGGNFNKSKAQIVTGVNVAHGPSVGRLKRIWRAERHQNAVGFQRGEILEKDFEASELRFSSRMAYANSIVKSSHRLVNTK